jgi:2-polyprenyl-6-methoxyphenol hydroxylase-like FAD-dependent oxidoreductase
MAPDDKSPILIVGAGPVGLMLAAELASHGIQCRIIDKAREPSDQSKALAVHARTLEIFDALGIAEETIAAGHLVHGMSAYSDGRRIAHLSFDEIQSRYPYVLILPQSDTEHILNHHLENQGLKVERGVELTGLAQTSRGVAAILRTATGAEEHFRTPWLVGCDGAHSAVRQNLDVGFEGKQYEENFWLADAKLDFDQPDDELYVYAAPDTLVAMFPMGGGRWRIVVGHAQATGGATPTLGQVQAAMERAGVRGARAHDPWWLAHFRISRRRVSSYDAGRVFLAGDSAHIHSPAGGQGMNTGIQDAFNLGWKLALVSSGAAPAELLETYHAERYPVSADVLRETDLMTRVIALRQPVAQAIRNSLLPILSASEVVQQRASRALAELTVNYRKSPIVGEHRNTLAESIRRAGGSGAGAWYEFGLGPMAGDRALDAEPIEVPGTAAHRLYEAIRGPHFNLLLFSGIQSTSDYRDLLEIAAAVRKRCGERVKTHLVLSRGEDIPARHISVIHDLEHALHRAYGAGARCLYLIRPDAYVGFRAQPPDAASLLENLNLIFK